MKDNHEYMSDPHKKLLTAIRDNDLLFTQTKEIDKRVDIAKSSINEWKEFITNEESSLSVDEFKIKDDTMFKLKDLFLRFKVGLLYIFIYN